MLPQQYSEMTDQQARQLCQQLRVQMIQTVSKTGGHLASSLGVVEILVAVHRVFDLDVDRLEDECANMACSIPNIEESIDRE